MTKTEVDIVVAGGGIAGMAATASFAAAGLRTVCVDPAPAPDPGATDGTDLRSTAFLEPAVDVLAQAGVWDRLAPHGADLAVMRLADAGGTAQAIRECADFTAAELGRDRFGVNIVNWRIREALHAHLADAARAELRLSTRVTHVTPRLNDTVLALSDGSQIRARLAVAADGRDSFLRQSAGISARRWDYGQKALVFGVAHDRPHEGVSTEIHRTGGPFTLVPLPDRDGTLHSAVVWMETGPNAAALAEAPVPDFEAALNARSCDVLGPLRLVTDRALWPIASQLAARFDGPRLALVAEAAHVMPPIGAQGLNTSLTDIRVLRDLVTGARDTGGDIGAADLLARYHRQRFPDVSARVLGIDFLNRAAMAQAPMLRDLRRAGLQALSGFQPVKSTAMRLGLGAGA
ncbi:MAG: FAD-dependent monooxygenase [Pseudomonadota bacterium]